MSTRAHQQNQEDHQPTVSEVKSRLRTLEDYNMAIKLQKEEFDTHFTKNRTQRQTAQIDCKVSKEQQAVEDESASMQLEKSKQKIEMDEKMALELAQKEQMEVEAERCRQLERDEQFARELDFKLKNNENIR